MWSVTVIDRDDAHYYQPGFLFIPFGFTTIEKITRKKSKFLPKDVEFIISEVERIDAEGSVVILADGRKINKSGVISTKELYEIFPGGPAKKAARIAGLPKPVGCV
jgi:NADH dehydrogenase FAD-containing subunit